MATEITNKATVNYNYGTTSAVAESNTASTTLTDPISIQKNTLSTTFRPGDEITYTISLSNGSTSPLSSVTITDDLGTYYIGTTPVTPLDYNGTANLYMNGVLSGPIVGTVGTNSLSFTLPTIAAGSTAQIIYLTTVNQSYPSSGGAILNTASFQAPSRTTIQDGVTVDLEEYADIDVVKAMSPNPVIEGQPITYTFTLYNYGNMPATDIVLTDSFTSAPAITGITVDESAVDAGDYDYTGGVLTLPKSGSALSLTVPQATVTQSGAGINTVTPGKLTIVVVGSL